MTLPQRRRGKRRRDFGRQAQMKPERKNKVQVQKIKQPVNLTAFPLDHRLDCHLVSLFGPTEWK